MKKIIYTFAVICLIAGFSNYAKAYDYQVGDIFVVDCFGEGSNYFVAYYDHPEADYSNTCDNPNVTLAYDTGFDLNRYTFNSIEFGEYRAYEQTSYPQTGGSEPETCVDWVYSEWSECIDSIQSREIVSSLPIDCMGGTSAELSQACEMPIEPPIESDNSLPPLATTTFEQITQNILSAFGGLVLIIVLISSTKFGFRLIKKAFPNAY